MKVLHINRNYITSALHQVMMGHLNSTGVESVVFAPTDIKETAAITPSENVIVSKCFNKWDRFIFARKQAKIGKALIAACDVSDFDCIHAYTLFTDGNTAMRLSEKFEIPYIVAVRNTDVNGFFKKAPHLRNLGIKIMRKASAICFLSEAYSKKVFDRYVPERYKEELLKKTHIIPNGIDDFWLNNTIQSIDPVHATRINRKELRLVYAGRIDKNKNISATLRGIKLLESDGWNVTFTVVGNIKDKAEYNKIVSSPYVTYIPAQPKEKLINIYRDCEIFIMPSFTETFGLVYAEAMSQGLPVIYTKGQGFDKQFEDGLVGYGVNCKNIYDIAEKIRMVVGDYANISDNCKKNAAKFEWDSICMEYKCLYKNIIRREYKH